MAMRKRREKGRKLPQVKPKKIRWRKDKEKRDREKRKGKKKKTKRKSKEGKEEMREGECVIRERGEKKKGTKLPFAISSEPEVEMHQGKRQILSTRRELHVGTRNCGFCPVPKSRGFSYTGYFLPSGHARAILVQL